MYAIRSYYEKRPESGIARTQENTVGIGEQSRDSGPHSQQSHVIETGMNLRQARRIQPFLTATDPAPIAARLRRQRSEIEPVAHEDTDQQRGGKESGKNSYNFV